MYFLILISLFFSTVFYSVVTTTSPNAIPVAAQAQAKPPQGLVNEPLVYFSYNDGATWQAASNGLPAGCILTHIQASDDRLLLTTKRHGIFHFDFPLHQWKLLPAQPPTQQPIDAIQVYQGRILAGTTGDGLFMSKDEGKSWLVYNQGLEDRTIRKISVLANQLFVGTNGGLYVFDEKQTKWQLVFGWLGLQVNGFVRHKGEMYIGTNQGVYKSDTQHKNWTHVLANTSLHNISSDAQQLYAMSYHNLFSSSDKGKSWHNIQAGLPKDLYTFQILAKGDYLLAAQWDGVYKRRPSRLEYTNGSWIRNSNGIPEKLAVTELVAYRNILIAGCPESKLKNAALIK